MNIFGLFYEVIMTKKQLTYTIVLFSLLGIMFIVLFVFSSQNAEDSSNLSDGLLLSILKIFISDFETISENQQTFLLESFSVIIRKLAHFSLFFIIGVLSFLSFYMFKINNFLKLVNAFGISVFYAIFDEVHQYFVPGRGASIYDVLIDISGSLFGIFVVSMVFLLEIYVQKVKNTEII